MSKQEKAYNATREGQMDMAYAGDSRAVAFRLNDSVKAMGGESWDRKMIEQADPAMLTMIKDDLIKDYNRLLAERKTKEPA